MCIGIPMTVSEVINDACALCVTKNSSRTLNTLLVGKVSEGDRVLAWKKLALSRLTEEEARNITHALEAIADIADGKSADLEAAFPDVGMRVNEENNHEPSRVPQNSSAATAALSEAHYRTSF